MKINGKKLAVCIAIPLLIGGVSAFLTKDTMQEFEKLYQPPLTPPNWLFPVVWTILYILMGISHYLIVESGADEGTIASAKRIYFFQLLLNFLWPTLFFNLGWYLFALFELVLLWWSVLIMIRRFADSSKVAAYLNIPYLIWLTFAAYLNLGVWWLNR